MTGDIKIVTALRRTLELVESSETAAYSHDTVEEIAQRLREAIGAIESGEPVDKSSLGVLFAPTGSIQETSLHNGWGDECLTLSQVVDRFLGK
jgi:hypothetical protein